MRSAHQSRWGYISTPQPDTINIKDNAVANTYVFPTIADRNAGTNEEASQDVRWNAGDIAITRNDGLVTIDEVWIYIPNGTGAQTASSADFIEVTENIIETNNICLLYTSPSPRDRTRSRMPSSA